MSEYVCPLSMVVCKSFLIFGKIYEFSFVSIYSIFVKFNYFMKWSPETFLILMLSDFF